MDLTPRYAPVATVLGPAFYSYNERGVIALTIGSERRHLQEVRRLSGRTPVERMPTKAFAARVARTLRVTDGAVVDWESMPGFQRRVLQECARIPSGSVMSYGDLATVIGARGAARAVGTALARNPVPLLVPCHRVIRADGEAGGYGMGGTKTKERLLRAEGA